MTRPARAHVSLSALRHNLSRVQQAAANSCIMAIIKANAYGHGLIPVAQALSGATAFGVASTEEALALREAGIGQRIVLLEGIFGADELGLVNGYRLDVVVHRAGQVEMLEQGLLTKPLDVWLKIDSGMHRLGFPPAAVPAMTERLKNIGLVSSIHFLSHLARADEPNNPDTKDQLGRFDQALGDVQGERSLANSAAVLAWPGTHYEWVRPGIMLYGASPFPERSASELDLQPVMTLRTELIAVNPCRRGDPIGYGGDWTCPEDMPVGVAAIGYGDGYPRHAPTGTTVLVNGQPASLAGRVSMDMICIDLRHIPDARVGDEVVLWGEGLPVEDVALAAGTISYELLCAVSGRVPREYSG